MDVEAWGTVNINASTPVGKATIPLLDVAYVPDFPTSLVSLDRALNRGFNWDTRTMCVTNGNGKALFNVK